MTVKELIERLKEFDPEMEVFVDCYKDEKYKYDNKWLSEVRDPLLGRPISMVKDNKIAQRACEETSGAKKCLVL